MDKLPVSVRAGGTVVTREYEVGDPIWGLEEEKRERKALADAQRDLAHDADRRAAEQVFTRG